MANLGLAVPPTKKVAKGLPVAQLRDGAMAAAELAAHMTRPLLGSIVDEACGIVDERRTELLLEALWLRVTRAPQLVTEYLKNLESHL
jgi:hypothetical protein